MIDNNGALSGVVEGFPKFETRDLDYVAFLLCQNQLYVIAGLDTEAKPVNPPLRVRLADMIAFTDLDAVYKDEGQRYTFVIQSEIEGESDDDFERRMKHVQYLFLNKKTLAEPIAFGAWRRQLRVWLIETDKRAMRRKKHAQSQR